jgi:hypothetical protein
VDSNDAPVNLLYAVLGLIVVGLGVMIILVQTGETRHALRTRWGFLGGAVVLIALGGLLFLSQAIAYFV